MSTKGAVLAVDDDAVSLSALKGTLTAAGYEVALAANGESALSSCVTAPPDLVLSDIRMPGMDGYELCRRLKGRPETRHIPVILISAVAEAQEWAEGLRTGAVDFISKPFQADELLARIGTHIDLSRAHAEIVRQAAALGKANEELRCELDERIQAEESARRAVTRLRAVVELTGQLTWTTNAQGEVVEDIPAWCEFTGQDRGHALGWGWTRALHPDDLDRTLRAWRQAVRNRGGYETEYRLRRKDGAYRDFLARGMPVLRADGTVAEWIGTCIDITERKRAEELIHRQRDDLAHVARVGVISELAVSLAHEISQPLAAILSNAQAALRFLKAGTPDLDEVRSALADIVSDDQRAGAVIKELRAFVKKDESRWEPLNMAEVIEEVHVITQSDAVIKNVAVDKDFATALRCVRGNRTQLQQVILNLFMNGCEAMEGIELARRVLRISVFEDGSGMVVVEIADRGRGLPDNVKQKIFDPLFTTKPQGLGMGLPIARTIAESHGGTLTAHNNSDRGATFRLALPAHGDRV